MKPATIIILALTALLTVNNSSAQNINYTSKVTQTTLLELYTSEGCSSCPPADRWFSQLKEDKRLWSELIPIAFHVDYWNYLGWKDKFSKAAFTKRQRDYAEKNYTRTVYTPNFFINDREWREWFNTRSLTLDKSPKVGILHTVLQDQHIIAEFTPSLPIKYPLLLNISLVGLDQTTTVKAGENKGKQLNHDFVALNYEQYPAAHQNNMFYWKIEDKKLMADLAKSQAIVFWVSTHNDPTPLQSTGGLLAPETAQ